MQVNGTGGAFGIGRDRNLFVAGTTNAPGAAAEPLAAPAAQCRLFACAAAVRVAEAWCITMRQPLSVRR